jgi:SNF2-related domain
MQTIGLLAALFRKTGTGADLIELHRRARMAEFFKNEIDEAKQQALEGGELYTASPQRTAPSTELEWGPVLILAPSSVLEAWVNAFKVWGHFSVALYQTGERKDILENVKLGSVEILVASHSRIQSDESATSLREIPWKLVIIDEFHKMKNVKSCLAQNLRLLRDAHDDTVLLGLTGTMMQNDHKELWYVAITIPLFDIVFLNRPSPSHLFPFSLGTFSTSSLGIFSVVGRTFGTRYRNQS